MRLRKRTIILKSVLLGMIVWMITAFTSPIIMDLVAFVEEFDRMGFEYEFGDLYKFFPIMVFFIVLVSMAIYLIPCIIGGIVYGTLIIRMKNTRLFIVPILIGIFVSILGVGTWAFLLPGHEYWIYFIVMSIFQSILWTVAIKRFDLWYLRKTQPGSQPDYEIT